jgi:NRPS condensation-like uncharacterized protein
MMTHHVARRFGRLNAFQRVMYSWSELHPYNATHTYQLAGPIDGPRLGEAIAATYRDLGIGVVELSADGRTFHWEPGSVDQIPVIAAGRDWQGCFSRHITQELNRPFPRPRCQPLRFSVLETCGSSYLTMSYDHWVADSFATRLILRHVLGRYLRLHLPENDRPLTLYPGTYRETFPQHLSFRHLAPAALRAWRQWRRDRAPAQPAYSCATQMAVSYEFHRTAPGTAARLRQFAQSLGATVHDVLLAAMARSLARVLPRRTRRGCPPEIALGTIVNTRADAVEDLGDSLGAFLSNFVVRCRPEESPGLAELVPQIASLTGPIKRHRRYFDAVVQMRVVSAWWPWVSQVTRPHFMRRAMPLTAGISNVRLRDDWTEQAGGRILGYSRGVSTGPMLPLVLSPTTLGEEMNLGLSYRATGFTREKIDLLVESLLEEIEQVEPVGSCRSLPAAA